MDSFVSSLHTSSTHIFNQLTTYRPSSVRPSRSISYTHKRYKSRHSFDAGKDNLIVEKKEEEEEIQLNLNRVIFFSLRVIQCVIILSYIHFPSGKTFYSSSSADSNTQHFLISFHIRSLKRAKSSHKTRSCPVYFYFIYLFLTKNISQQMRMNKMTPSFSFRYHAREINLRI